MPFRFVHTADLHLDSPLRSLALKNPELAELVRGATRTALAAIIDLCIAEDVDALLIAGDLYDGTQTSINTALYLGGQLRRLESAGIRVFIIRGNHDHQSAMTRELSFPPNVHVFGGRARAIHAKTLENGRDVHVHGISFANAHAPESLLPSFHAPIPDAINIGLLHTSLAGKPGHDPYAPCHVADLFGHGFDYWALGHIHQREVHSEKPLIVMPGMPQGRDINEAGQKSVTLVIVSDEGGFTLEERRIGHAVFERISVDLTGIADWSAMMEHVGAGLRSLKEETGPGHLIVRLRLVGETSLAWKLRRDPDYAQGEIVNVAAGLAGCWIETVDIACRSLVSDDTVVGPDPAQELAALVHGDVLLSHDFGQEVRQMVEEFLLQLPRELRDRFFQDEASTTDFIDTIAHEGSEDVLAHLIAGARTSGAHG